MNDLSPYPAGVTEADFYDVERPEPAPGEECWLLLSGRLPRPDTYCKNCAFDLMNELEPGEKLELAKTAPDCSSCVMCGLQLGFHGKDCDCEF